jgi:hypothetical protein
MSREIRRVPAHWQHPRYTRDTATYRDRVGTFIPLFDDYDRHLAEFAAAIKEMGLGEALEHHGGGPIKDDYTQYEGKPLDWWQLYESVTEGTPCTPAFATAEELIDHLVNVGSTDGEEGSTEKWTRAQAEAIVKEGWCPSMVITGGRVKTGRESLDP